jgi:hypothetical protein
MTEALRKLLDQVRNAIRLKHYSSCTEQTYINWIYRFSLFHKGTSKNRTISEKLRAESPDFSLQIFHVFGSLELPINFFRLEHNTGIAERMSDKSQIVGKRPLNPP